MVINMTEKEILVSYALEKKQVAYENSMITNTKFLSIDERTDMACLERKFSSDVRTFYYGGYDDAERAVAVFVPSFFDIEDGICDFFKNNNYENPIALIRLKKDRFSSLSHRDYLGALIGLGIKREVLGDILTLDDGCYIFCLKSMAEFICRNLVKAGRGTVECYVADNFDLTDYKVNFEEIFQSVASLRLDNVISSSFGISRTSAAEAINKGIVYVNSVKALKSDFQVKEKDRIVLRGKGKAILSEITGFSKKGRIHIVIKKYR